jgi:hypothetical protein
MNDMRTFLLIQSHGKFCKINLGLIGHRVLRLLPHQHMVSGNLDAWQGWKKITQVLKA